MKGNIWPHFFATNRRELARILLKEIAYFFDGIDFEVGLTGYFRAVEHGVKFNRLTVSIILLLKGKKMSQNVLQKRPHLIPAIIAAAMLFGASGLWPCSYDDQLFRIVTCGVSLYVAHMAYKWQKIWAVWLFGFIAILFNPLTALLGTWSLIHFSREIWQPIGIICAVLFTVIAFILRKPAKEKNAPRHLRYNVIWLAIIVMLAYISLFGSIDHFVEANANRKGGYISISVGGGDEYIDEWVDAAQYKRHHLGRAGEDFIAACVAVGFFCYGLGTKENEFTESTQGQ